MANLSQKESERLQLHLLELRERIKGLFSKFQTVHDLATLALSDKSQIPLFAVRFAKIDNYFQEFEDVQSQILTACVKLDELTDYEADKKIAKKLEDLYYSIVSINTQLNPTVPSQSTERRTSSDTSSFGSVNVKQSNLPKLNLPAFNGNLSEWPQFCDAFKCLVHQNSSLSEIEKFYYLRNSLSGSPLNIIKTIPLISANYEIAWNALLDRYENKRILANNYLNKILKFKILDGQHSLTGLQSFLDVFYENVSALKGMNIPNLADFIITSLALRSLNSHTRTLFETEHPDEEFPTFEQLIGFVKKQCHILEMSKGDNTSHSQKVVPKPKSPTLHKRSFMSTNEKPSVVCPHCKKSHKLNQCEEFLKLSVTDRHHWVKTQKRCFNCLGSHLVTKCSSKNTCNVCHRKHHSLLHFVAAPQNETSQSEKTIAASQSIQSLNCSSTPSTTVLLSTAVVLVKDVSGSFQPIRLVVDSGSQISCITDSCVQKLNLPRRKHNVPLSGLGEVPVHSTKGIVSCIIASRLPSQPELNVEAVVLPRISSELPSTPLPATLKAKFMNLFLADPQFNQPGPIDFLLGADLWPQIFSSGQIINSPGYPSAYLSIFGWLIMGPVAEPSSQKKISLLSHTSSLESTMKQFWEIEEVSPPKISNPDDLTCEEHFMKTHYRDSTGRYVVEYPFKLENPNFGDSRSTALSRFHKLEFRLSKNPTLHNEYSQSLQEYIDIGHMQKADCPAAYVIPHHCVIKDSSSTTKVRIVFDASTRTSSHGSLNDSLFVGPKLQKDITEVITNFRTHAITVCADIRQMYRQILVSPVHRKYQHILWRNSPEESVQEYELNTVTFGIASSPYLAMRVIKQLVLDEGHNYPAASRALLNHILVDDIISGAASTDDALILQKQLIELLELGGFQLRKWMSNDSSILDSIPEEDKAPLITISDESQNVTKILGIQWDHTSDGFCFHITNLNVTYTKRGLLSVVARFYDPLGWASPVIFLAKYWIQQLWQAKYDWDSQLPSNFVDIWQNLIVELPLLRSVRISRFILSELNYNCQLIGFSDASERGYSCVVYLRCEDSLGVVKIHLVKAKTKVSPLKTLSIPRLELCGALLLARTVKSLQHLQTSVSIQNTYLFCDSTIVLAWLRTPPHTLKSFVANRVVEILESTCLSSWFHIPSENNPADCSSRGILPQALLEHSLWWSGPAFLQDSTSAWPINEVTINEIQSLPEIKTNATMTLAVADSSEIAKWMDTFSTFSRLQRTVAYVIRFINNTRSCQNRCVGPLSSLELESSLMKIVYIYQSTYFSKELKFLKDSLPLSKPLQQLAPFLDESGILRVGGRLKNATLPFETKCPILIPKKTHLANLLIDYYHNCYLHVGPRTLQSLLQRRFWVISARNNIRSRIRRCTRCFKFGTPPFQPYMADLPSARTEAVRAFLRITADFGGPLLMKESIRRNAKTFKVYFCVFVCMSTKAVHLEPVTSLSTEAVLATLDRFISRRGVCSEIFTDCGTNFVGAARYLKDLYALLESPAHQTAINNKLAKNQIVWRFNCPGAPHFNGLSEAAVKSTKHHLRRVMGDRPFTYEEFTTILCKIEAILNSRPLCPISPDPHEIDCLTPGHFLIGTPLVAIPHTDLTVLPENRLNRWQLVQQVTQHFWKRWSREYLHTLQQRSKWNYKTRNPIVGDLVLISDTRTTPTQWPVAIIDAVHPGKDGVIRVVTVRTSSGSYTRPLVNLVPFPSQK